MDIKIEKIGYYRLLPATIRQLPLFVVRASARHLIEQHSDPAKA
jgi:hypothetical protein